MMFFVFIRNNSAECTFFSYPRQASEIDFTNIISISIRECKLGK